MSLNPEDVAFLTDLATRIRKQDNRCTAAPYYYVIRRERWRVAHDEFNTYETRKVRVDFDGDPDSFHSKEQFTKWWRGQLEENQTATQEQIDAAWEKLPEFTEELFYEEENCFLTEDAYKQHLELNGHNLRGKYHSYVKHAFRNPELAKLFEIIAKFAPAEARA